MATGGKDTNVRVKVEPMSPSRLSNTGILAKFPTATVKKELGGRLASFKPPRDLSLSAASSHLSGVPNLALARKTYAPNINAVRRKGQVPIATADSSMGENKPTSDRMRRQPKNKSNFIQTTGVFSSGLAPGKPKEYSRANEPPSPQIEKPKLILNKSVCKKKEESRMKDIMKDDFIDDPSVLPDLNDCPKSLPLHINAKPHCYRDLDDTFQSLQMKTEKYENIKAEELDSRTPELSRFFSEPGLSRLIVMDFPEEIPMVDDSKKSAKELKEENSKTDPQSKGAATHRLANLNEGRWGTLKILANGAAYILVGSERIPVMMTRHCPRQTVMSVGLDTANSKGELVNLGPVSATLKCFSDLSPQSLEKNE